MIFVTVGTQGPFDRLIRPIDGWAHENDRSDVFAQIGRNAWKPTRLEWVEHLDAGEFRDRVARAEAVVSHAGMGTILTALELRRPLLIMPRRVALLEQRNDHQVATARKLQQLGLATVAEDEDELADCLRSLDALKPPSRAGAEDRGRLLEVLRRFCLSSGPSLPEASRAGQPPGR